MARNRPAKRVPLNQARIFEAAVELVEQSGVEELSMRKLAAVLGVDAMSIYHHVPNKQALLMGIYQRVLEELPLPPSTTASWQESLRELSRQFYLLACRYPKVFPHLISSPYGTPRELEIYHHIKSILIRSGLNDEDRVRATGSIYTYAIGIANVAANGLSLRPLYNPEDGAAAEDAPAETGRAGCAGGAADFEFSVDLLIAGIEQRLLKLNSA